MASVAVITSGKGGVGKSSITAGLGAALVKRGRRVLLIDCDAGLRSLDYFLGVTEHLVYDASDIVAGNCAPLKAIYPCHYSPGLFLLPAPQQVEHIILPELMREVVSSLEKYFDVILMDSPAGIGRGFYTAVAPASHAFLVATADPVCLRDTEKVRRTLEKQGIQYIRLLINRFQLGVFRKSGYYEDLDAVIDAAGVQLLGVIPEDVEIISAAAQGRGLSPHSRSAKAFNRIAARMDGERMPLARLEKI